jgi:hypothetical protein
VTVSRCGSPFAMTAVITSPAARTNTRGTESEAAMPLYLDEIWLEWSDAENARRVLGTFGAMGSGNFPFPEGVRLVAGPWFSNEEAKVILVLDIRDHAKTFETFGLALAHQLIARRRLTPIVDWAAVHDLLRALTPDA